MVIGYFQKGHRLVSIMVIGYFQKGHRLVSIMVIGYFQKGHRNELYSIELYTKRTLYVRDAGNLPLRRYFFSDGLFMNKTRKLEQAALKAQKQGLHREQTSRYRHASPFRLGTTSRKANMKTKKKRRPNKLELAIEAAAYHEAGHAVVAVLTNVKFKCATIVPNLKMAAMGHLKVTPKGHGLTPEAWKKYQDGLDDGRVVKRIDALICVALAGLVAETIYTGRRNWKGAGKDYQAAEEYAHFRCNGWKKSVPIYMELQAREAERWLCQYPMHWKWVEAVAGALLKRKTLTQKEVIEILSNAFPV
jgi:hypothetical protein